MHVGGFHFMLFYQLFFKFGNRFINIDSIILKIPFT